jgi:hypothetical protein
MRFGRFDLRGLLSGLSISVTTVVLMLAAGEIGIRWLRPQEHMRTEMLVMDPVLGYRMAPNYRGSYVSKKDPMPLTTNSWGMRDHDYGPRPQGGVRIFVLGDSMIFGYGVGLEQTLPKQLERSLQQRVGSRQVEVVNGGVFGYGTFQEIEFFKQTVDTVQPDIVLLGLYIGNDITDNLEYTRPSLSRPGGWRTQGLKSWLRVHSQLYGWARRRYNAIGRRGRKTALLTIDVHARAPSARTKRGLALTESAVEALAGAVHRRGIRFALILIPRREQVYPLLWQRTLAQLHLSPAAYDRHQPNARLAAFAESHGIPVVDLLAPLEARQHDDLYFVVHWTPLGNSVAAEATADFLLKSGMLDAPAAVAAGDG